MPTKRALIVLLMVVIGAARLPAASEKWVSGFYVGYAASSYPPSAIDFSALTHILVFALLPRADGTLDTSLFIDSTKGPQIAQEIARRAHAAGKQALLAIGGTNSGPNFRTSTRPQNMRLFVQNIVRIVNEWQFDGADIDWEPLQAADYQSCLLLINQLKAAKPGIILTADVGWQRRNRPLAEADAAFFARLARSVDQLNMMTYGMADSWGGWVVWHSSAVFGDAATHPTSVQMTVAQYVAAGVPPSKLGVGIGFFGACWNAPARTPLQDPAAAHVVASDNEMSFDNINTLYHRGTNYHYDDSAAAAYLSFLVPVGPHKCTFISYEDETSVAAKGAYAAQAGLGGAMIWQLNEGYVQTAADPNALLHAVARAFLSRAPSRRAPPK